MRRQMVTTMYNNVNNLTFLFDKLPFKSLKKYGKQKSTNACRNTAELRQQGRLHYTDDDFDGFFLAMC